MRNWQPRILSEYKRRIVYTFIWCFVSMVLIGAVAYYTKRPYIFPSLGPTALLLFAHPLQRDSSPRHVLLGHFIGAASGYGALFATGLLAAPYTTDIVSQRILAVAIALGLTAALTTLARSEHAPSGATTLIVALGILPKIEDIVWLMVAVAMLTIFAFVVNRMSGIAYPPWNAAPWVKQHDAELLKKLSPFTR